MSVATELLQAFATLSQHLPLPRVRALHLPRSEHRKQSSFCAVELDDGTPGLAYIALGDTRERLAHVDTASLAGANALTVAQGYVGGDGAARSIGFATINALTRWLFDRAGFEPPHSAGSLGEVALKPGERVGMVGLFGPLVKQIRESGAHLTILELPPVPELDREGYRVTHDPAALRDCTRVLSTSTVLLNDSFESLRVHCLAATEFVLIGPGASCLPDPLFARGVTRLGGSWILDPAGVFDALETGRSWSEYARKSALDRLAYPGFEALLGRL
ncbi:MAG: hypothetical protein KGL40_08410 [Rhodocyclaceae bacterium]|nr:hypothetical protein [Rhodocyclaceae bacterium]